MGYGWGDCDERNVRNRRLRSSIIIDKEDTSLLVDTSPDLRQQLLNYGSNKVDAVIFTHTHYDHIGGLNELRPLFFKQKKRLNIYARENDMELIKKEFFYLFEKSDHEIYDTYIEPHVIKNKFTIGDISGVCLEQNHGFSESIGIRIDDFAYSTDVAFMSDETLNNLKGINTWIVDCLSLKSIKPTHAHLDQVLRWIEKVGPRQTFLTHMGTTMDYDTLLQILPKNIKPAHDQMVIFI